MPSIDEEREVLKSGVFIAVFSSALLVVVGLFWGFPWQALLLLVVVSVAIGGLISGMTLADVRSAARRKALTHGALTTWAGRNGGSFGTTVAAFTGDAQGWESPASPRFRGELLAVGRPQGVEVGVACCVEDVGEAGTAVTAVLVRLRGQRPPARLSRREIRRLDLPQGVDSVETGDRELLVRYEGWPHSSSAVDVLVDAAVHLATNSHDVGDS
ncbi:hypothetical protein [Streptomyces sp. NPDC020747]|uniref:hypothetical protein n=1 Tax=Streptomyces sp. NPDC020747 TaxID=3365086 RepID=UPI00379CB951